MAKHDIVLLNTTSSGFETDLGSNVARIKGTADDLFSVRNSSEVNKFAISSVEDSMIIGGDLTLTGNLSSSLNSTASFGKIVATKFVGDASQMTNTNEVGHVSSSKQLASRISGAFTAGFEVIGDISGSVTSTGSFTKVVANTYVGSGAELFDPPSVSGEISGSAQIATQVSGAFTSGFTITKSATISGSGTSTGSFGLFPFGTTRNIRSTIQDTSGFTGLPSFVGFISSSDKLASSISGSFTSGMLIKGGQISGSVTSTGSFGRVDGIDSITGDASQVTGLAIPTNSVSASVQLASNISGSFTSGFEFDNSISGSVTSTGSFSRLNFNSLSVTDVSGITGHEIGHASASSVIAAGISASFQGGFGFNGTISGSSPSNLKIQSLNLGGTNTFGETNLVKNWDSSFVRTATFGANLGAAISGAFQSGFVYQGTISGSATSTGSFSKIQANEIIVKEMVGVRKPISGSIGHDNYISASYKTDSHGRVTIPVRGRTNHSVNTQQFTATSSMEDQTYRARAGQLFIDNWGRLNMTVQTGSMVAVAGTWTEGPAFPNPARAPGGVGVANAAMVAGGAHITSSAQYDGISWFDTPDTTHKRDAGGTSHNKSVGTVDAALFIGHTGGVGGSSAPGFSGVPNFNDFFEIWDGVTFSRCGTNAGRISGYSFRYGAGTKGGSSNSHLVFGGDYGEYGYVRTSCWNGTNWSAASYNLNNDREYGAGFGGPHDAVYVGGGAPLAECTEEWNGSTWATATALPTAQSGGGMGHTQNAGLVTGGNPSAKTQEYNGTTWSEATDLLSGTNEHGTAGSAATGFVLAGLGGSKPFQQWTGGFITGSAETYNKFSQNPTGRYLLTKKLQANHSPGCAGGGSTLNDEDFGGGY